MQAVFDAWEAVSALNLRDLFEVSPLWLFGLLIGFLSPKQPLLSDFKSFFASCLGLALAGSAQSKFATSCMLCLHGMVFIQTLWLRNTEPGTFHRYLESVLASVAGSASEADRKPDRGSPGHPKDTAPEEAHMEWFVTAADLEFYRSRVEREDAPVRAEPWQLMVQKTIENQLEYRAYRRLLKDLKKTEYLSVSVSANSTPHEVMDFYLSDPTRQKWDSLLACAETIQSGDFDKRQQLVHWRRSFPFAFLSDRDYVIARQLFQDNDILYGVSKVVPYPNATDRGAVRMETYWSMWSCKPVTCPFGSGRPATETTLLHMEDFMIPENLSRFAVKAGMWGFIKKMSPYMQNFIEDRRSRGVGPNDRDPQAFGAPSSNLIHSPDDDHRNRSVNADRSPRPLRKIACGVAAVAMVVLLGHGGDKRRKERAQGE